MFHVRLGQHNVPLQFLVLGAIEFAILAVSPYVVHQIRFDELPTGVLSPLLFATVQLAALLSMRVYGSFLRESYEGVALRTAVALFLIGDLALAVLFYLIPEISLGRSVLAIATLVAFLALMLVRVITWRMVDLDVFRKRVLVLGAGNRALRIVTRLRRRSDQRTFRLHGFVPVGGACRVAEHGATIVDVDGDALLTYCREHHIEEMVVAIDERRRSESAAKGLPVAALLDCRLSGIAVVDVAEFFEREAAFLPLEMLSPSWMIFGGGFRTAPWQEFWIRCVDIVAAAFLLLLASPVIAVTAVAILVEGRFRGPVLYRQSRVGLNGVPFDVLKFRSMVVDAERDGKAVWAQAKDPRVTRVGAFIRSTRIDEIPQVWNVLRGEMSFVGPRPERPAFVESLSIELPYYGERHRVKPGITGWAQLRYPYGASVNDAREKLQYDLYYMKHRSVLFNLLIMMQTIEVVLLGSGAR